MKIKADILIKPILTTVLISTAIFFALALILIASQRPKDLSGFDGISFGSVSGAMSPDAIPISTLTLRDGTQLAYRHIPATKADASLIVIIHGSGWHGGGYLDLATALGADGAHEVLIPDLRGHGAAPARRGDIDYIGQFEDDLAALVGAFGGEDRHVTFVGHSSGGGLVIRMAGGAHGALMDRAVLIAPFLHHRAPTLRENAGGWAHVMTRRIAGLAMLNMARIRALNHLPIIQFNFPKAVLEGDYGHTATTRYSFRLNTSFAPRNDYQSDIAKLPIFLNIVGAEDDAFKAKEFKPLLSKITGKGSYTILPNADHLSILHDPRLGTAILDFFNQSAGEI